MIKKFLDNPKKDGISPIFYIEKLSFDDEKDEKVHVSHFLGKDYYSYM